MEIRAAAQQDRHAIRELMKKALGGDDLLAVNESMMSWKYDRPRPDWNAARAIVAVEGEALAAHAGIWPVELRGRRGVVRAVHLIDWVAERSSAGAGIAVYTAGLTAEPAALVIGGSSQARRILPKLGFRTAGEMRIYARPLKIWRQLRDRKGCPPLRRLALAGRNLLWRLSGGGLKRSRWNIEQIREFGPAHSCWLEVSGDSGFISAARSASSMNYLLECPAAPVTAWQAGLDGEPRALIVLARAGAQMRIADLRVRQDTLECWTLAYATAATIADSLGASEIAAGSTDETTARALALNGFYVRAVKPVWVRDRSGVLEHDCPFRLQMADSDGFFVYDAGDPYLT